MIHCIYTWQMAQATTGKDKNRRESKAYVYVRLEVQKTGNDSSKTARIWRNGSLTDQGV